MKRNRLINRSLLVFVTAAPAIVCATEFKPVRVEGGPDATGQAYSWKIENKHKESAIVEIIIPHFRAARADGPAGTDATVVCTELVAPGRKIKPGECTITAPDGKWLIPAGRTGEITMQVAREFVKRTRGTMTFKFADGRVVIVEDVWLPGKEAALDRYVPTAGMAAIAVVFMVMGIRRHRARRVKEQTSANAS